MRVYELALILRTSLTEANRKKLLENIKNWLLDVKISKETILGEKELAYPIKREVKGIYHLLSLEAKDRIPQDLEKRILGQEDILRHLLIRTK